MKALRKVLMAILLLAANIFASSAQEYDIFLLIGQSNMAGRGVLTSEDKAQTVEGVFLLNEDGIPVPATLPFNQYSTIRKTETKQGMNPGYSFSQAVYAYEKERPILIVCNARGGSSITKWGKGSKYYAEAARRTLQAMKYGSLKGILWHQGCSDLARVDEYMDLLTQMVAGLRADLGCPDVPFVAGEIGTWMPDNTQQKAFNKMIRTIRRHIPNSDWVSAAKCEALYKESKRTSNDPHFSRKGQILLGKRYARKMIKMAY